MTSIVRLFTLGTLLALTGCASASSSKAAAPKKKSRPVRPLSAVEVSPPSLMVAKKIERPLIIVLDPQKVADVQGPVKWSFSRYDVTEFHLFVERDLKGAMEAFFTEVSIANPGDALPEAGAIVADVRVDKLEGVILGQVAAAELTWAMAIRPVEAEEYLFSYAGKSVSEPRRSVNKMVASALERGIADMVAAWTDKEVTQALKALPPLDAAPAADGDTTAL